jgi:predicted deacylase
MTFEMTGTAVPGGPDSPERRRRRLAAVVTALALAAAPAYVGAAAASPSARASGDYSAVLRTVVIGTTVQGRPIIARQVGDPASPRKVLLLGAMHGDETGPSRMLQRILDGPKVHGADIWIIRVLNRDGVARHTRRNAHGVDLNRNFPRQWRRAGGPYDSGPRPASEPETRALMAFLERLRPAAVVSFHQPLHGVGRSGLPRGRALQSRLAHRLHLPLKSFNCRSGCHGTMTEWFNARFPGVAITVEYGRHLSRHQRHTAPAALLRAVGARR